MDIICRDCIYWGFNNGKPMKGGIEIVWGA